MVEIIGVATIVGLSWVLAFSMANENDAQKRRRASSGFDSTDVEKSWKVISSKHAA